MEGRRSMMDEYEYFEEDWYDVEDEFPREEEDCE